MGYDRDVRNAVNGYLEKVAAELANLSRDERESILENVESHVYEELRKNFGEGATEADAQAIISRMAPARSYAEAGGGASEASTAPRKRLCLYPIVGLLVAPFGLCLLAIILGNILNERRVTAEGGVTGGWSLNLAGFIIISAIPIVTTVLGIIGIKKIRDSDGQLTGMGWAVTAAVFFPACIVLGGILCIS